MSKKPTRIQVRPIHSKQFVMDWLGAHPETSRRALCRAAGLDESTLTKAFSIAQANKEFDKATLKALAKAMKVSVADISGPSPSIIAAAAPAADDAPTVAGSLRENFGLLPHRLLIPNPENPRTEIDPQADDALMQSIDEIGIQQPLAARPLADGRAMIIGGHRRWRQVGRLIEAGRWGAEYPLPVYFTLADGRAAMRAALAENMHRVDLTPLEEGQAYLLLRGSEDDADVWSIGEVAVKVGRSTQHVEMRIALVTKLCDHAKAWLRDGTINFTRARILCQFEHPQQMLILRAMDQNDAILIDGSDDAFRQRAHYLVDLQRNGGVHTKPMQPQHIAEGPRDESLAYDHQPEQQREQRPPTGEQDNTRFEPPPRDEAEIQAATAAFEGDGHPDSAGSAAGTVSVRDDLADATAQYRDWQTRIIDFESRLRLAAAGDLDIGLRLLMMHVLNNVEVEALGQGAHCLAARDYFPALDFDDEAAADDYPLALARPGFTAALWWPTVSPQRASARVLASLITLPCDWKHHRYGISPDLLAFWQAVATDLNIAWPDDLYTTSSSNDDADDAADEAA